MIINNAINVLTPLLLISLGALITDISGTLNIALEGLITISTLFSIIGAALTQSIFLGTLIGVFSSIILASLLSYLTSKLKANIFITGLAINLFASGITTITTFHLYNTRGVVSFENLPQLNKFPIFLLGKVTIFFPLSILLIFITYILIEKTPLGLRIKACGMDPHSLKSYGISRSKIKLIAFCISGFFCGLAGSFLSLNLGSFVPGISAGKGWISLVIVYLASSKIKYILPATIIFALSESISIYLQGTTNIPSDIILTLPSLFTLIIMILVSIFIKQKQIIER